MPVISRFYGLAVKMYFKKSEHNPPHIHVLYGEYMGAIDIKTQELMEKAIYLTKPLCWLRNGRKNMKPNY